ncbi:hypothetical protein BOTNAR_0059g00340 [Botryotinia narcissicola]|uniref:Uncharacterized protein n=1 Tax=Botryotinia narcissicola TaxID=278944 RepID=A0A4Z1JBK6_9HELO|nr:hypothetical protein BOTNAR_0059g00340 [Botryotinia narcissicola]
MIASSRTQLGSLDRKKVSINVAASASQRLLSRKGTAWTHLFYDSNVTSNVRGILLVLNASNLERLRVNQLMGKFEAGEMSDYGKDDIETEAGSAAEPEDQDP